jgi:hypothetical protein
MAKDRRGRFHGSYVTLLNILLIKGEGSSSEEEEDADHISHGESDFQIKTCICKCCRWASLHSKVCSVSKPPADLDADPAQNNKHSVAFFNRIGYRMQ